MQPPPLKLRNQPRVTQSLTASRTDPASKFEYTTKVGGANFEIEVKLANGSMNLVRGDLDDRKLIFDGEIGGGSERLTVRVPAGYDLGGHLRAVKRLQDGYCRLLIPRESIHRTHREG